MVVSHRKDLLRVLTCGSVDDGKSTLIGRLLYDSKGLYDDHLSRLKSDSRRIGSTGGGLDFSLLLDGLRAEREQGITIDVAYRYFSTPRRTFIVADCPGHVQYTRNMVTGGSTASLAVVLVDAEKGVLEQTKRHSFIVSLLDIGHIVVAVNKMDRVGYDETVFEKIRQEYTEFAARLAVRHVHFIPVSALHGDNVVAAGGNMPWYQGTPILPYLESVHIASDRNLIDLRFPVQHVIRPDMSFRGYAGSIASGIARVGAEVIVLPSRHTTRIRGIHTADGDLSEAAVPQAVALTVESDIDISRGDMIVYPRNLPRVERELEAVVVWMSDEPLTPERSYLIKHCTTEVRAEIADIRYRFDVHTLHRVDASALTLNDIGRVLVRCSRPLAFDPYVRNHATGSFIVIDPVTNGTVGAGMIIDRITQGGGDRALRAGAQRTGAVTLEERMRRLGHLPLTLRLTDPELAVELERRLFEEGYTARTVDAAQSARLLNDTGIIAIVTSAETAVQLCATVGADRFVDLGETEIDEAMRRLRPLLG